MKNVRMEHPETCPDISCGFLPERISFPIIDKMRLSLLRHESLMTFTRDKQFYRRVVIFTG